MEAVEAWERTVQNAITQHYQQLESEIRSMLHTITAHFAASSVGASEQSPHSDPKHHDMELPMGTEPTITRQTSTSCLATSQHPASSSDNEVKTSELNGAPDESGQIIKKTGKALSTWPSTLPTHCEVTQPRDIGTGGSDGLLQIKRPACMPIAQDVTVLKDTYTICAPLHCNNLRAKVLLLQRLEATSECNRLGIG